MTKTLDRARQRAGAVKRFTEDVAAAHDRIDREAGVIYGVHVLGAESRNGRRYSEQAMQTGVSLYENRVVYVDHRKGAPAERSLLEAFGHLKSLRREGEKVVGDLHYLKTHAAAPQLLERIEREMPIGLSHDAEGPMDRTGRIVEDLTHVYSVDLVLNPATNQSLFESEGRRVPKTIKQILEAHRASDKRAARLLEMDAMDMPVGEMPIEPVAEEPDPEMEVDAALAALVMAVLGEDLTVDEKISKIGDILKAAYPEAAPAEGGDAPADGGGDAPAMESVRLRREVDELKRSIMLREEIEAAGATLASLGTKRVDLLRQAKDRDGVRALLESWGDGVRPATSRPKPDVRAKRLTEGAGSESYDAMRKSLWKTARN